MSLSNNTDVPNPAHGFMKWVGKVEAKGGGVFSYWDKEQKMDIAVPLPLRFLVLDVLSTIKGFNDDNQQGYWSNEVKKIGEDTLIVKTKVNKKVVTVAEGIYRSLHVGSGDLKGAKYTQSVYVAMKGEGGRLEIWNLQLLGAALSEWIEFSSKNKIYGKGIVVDRFEARVKGVNDYLVPIFSTFEAPKALVEEATKLDLELQEYLKIYFNRGHETVAATQAANEYVSDANASDGGAWSNDAPAEAEWGDAEFGDPDPEPEPVKTEPQKATPSVPRIAVADLDIAKSECEFEIDIVLGWFGCSMQRSKSKGKDGKTYTNFLVLGQLDLVPMEIWESKLNRQGGKSGSLGFVSDDRTLGKHLSFNSKSFNPFVRSLGEWYYGHPNDRPRPELATSGKPSGAGEWK